MHACSPTGKLAAHDTGRERTRRNVSCTTTSMPLTHSDSDPDLPPSDEHDVMSTTARVQTPSRSSNFLSYCAVTTAHSPVVGRKLSPNSCDNTSSQLPQPADCWQRSSVPKGQKLCKSTIMVLAR